MHSFLSMIDYICQVFALPKSCESTRDGRPHVQGDLNGVSVYFLVDTGASVSVVSEGVYRSIQGHWNLHTVPRNMQRPFYVIRGLNRTQAILGIDFVREQQLVIDVDHVFFKNLPKPEQAMCATLRAPRDFGIASRTVLRTELTVHSARGEFLIPKLCRIASCNRRGWGLGYLE